MLKMLLIGKIVYLEVSSKIFLDIIAEVEIPDVIAAVVVIILSIQTTADSTQQICLPCTATIMNTDAITIRLKVRWINPHRYSLCLFCGFTPNVGITDIIAPHRTKLLLEGQLHATALFFINILHIAIPTYTVIHPIYSIMQFTLKY